MIFSLTAQQINDIKTKYFPEPELVTIKNVILKLSGTDSILELKIEIKDKISSNVTEQPKIFNNKNTQKKMKMLLFEITNDDMRGEILKCKTTEEIKDVLNTYGSLQILLSPADDFSGDKKNIKEHSIDENGYVSLMYNKKLILPEPQIKYLSLGIIFYFDLETYIKEEKVQPEFVEKETLINKINEKIIHDLIRNDEPLENSNVVDLRLIKSMFRKSFSDVNTNAFTDTKEEKFALWQEKSYSLLETINSDVNLENNIINILSEAKKQIPSNKYFSNAYFSRNINGNLSFLFNLDYYNLIQNNSSYKKQIINSNLKDEFTNQIMLLSLKVLRRKVKKIGDTKKLSITPLNDQVTFITTGYPEKETLSINSIKETNSLGTIKETSLFLNNSFKNDVRSFEVIDNNVFGLKTGLYQYGVQITLLDTFTSFIQNKLDVCYQDIANLKKYLKETDNIVKTRSYYERKPIRTRASKVNYLRTPPDPSTATIVSVQEGVYDALTSSFTKKFVRETFPKLYSNNVKVAVNNFIALLNLFGVQASLDVQLMSGIFLNLLLPTTGNSETILHFIKSYEKFVNQIQKIISNNSNQKINLEHWFSNDYVNSDERIDLGYQFIENEIQNGLGTISIEQLNFLISNDISKYASSKSLDMFTRDSSRYHHISPKIIKTANKIVNLDETITNPNVFSQYDYSELEIDIKRYNSLKEFGNNVTVTNKPNNMPIRQQQLNLRMNNIMQNLSVSVTNLYNTPVKKISEINNINEIRSDYNSKVDPAYLFLALSKNINNKNDRFILQKNQPPFLKNTKSLKIFNNKYDSSVPYHIRLLLENNARLLKQEDDYLNSLDFKSIFLLYYNTIHSIEYIQYNPVKNKDIDLKNELWLKLDDKAINRIANQDLIVLCRLKLFQNSSININNWDQVKMPIYNQYFLLSGKPTNFSKKAIRPATFNGFTQSMRGIIDESVNKKIAILLKNPILPSINIPTINKQSVMLKKSLTPATKAISEIPKTAVQAKENDTNKAKDLNSANIQSQVIIDLAKKALQNGALKGMESNSKNGKPPFIDRKENKNQSSPLQTKTKTRR